MKIIVGLGNPGEEYEKTRHNVGFMFLDQILRREEFSLDSKKEALMVKKDGLIIVKPQTFMNESGRAVRKILDFYKLSSNDVVVIHDDLDIAFGEYKIQKGVGPKVHNGIKSIEQSLGTDDFWRVRVGVDNRQPSVNYGTGADYVLSKVSKEEVKDLKVVFVDILKELEVALGLDIK
jgi:PTH1 family peptidyl-tRNA hydrolase